MPINSIDPGPSVAAIARNKSTAAGTTRFPIVDPGKKPSRGIPSADSGRANLYVKSAFTGYMGRSGNRTDRATADSPRNSPEISIGTYAEGSTVDSKIGVFADEPDPNSTSTRPCPV